MTMLQLIKYSNLVIKATKKPRPKLQSRVDRQKKNGNSTAFETSLSDKVKPLIYNSVSQYCIGLLVIKTANETAM